MAAARTSVASARAFGVPPRDEAVDVGGGGGGREAEALPEAAVAQRAGVFVGAVLVRCVVELAERAGRAAKPVVVIGAPGWLVQLAPRLDMPPLPFAATPDLAVSALRAACSAGVPALH